MSMNRSIRHSSQGNGHGDNVPGERKIDVLLVDDDPAFLRSARRLLEKRYGDRVDIIGTAGSAESCLAQAQLLAPQVVLMGVDTCGLTGLGTIPLIHILFPEIRVIALTRGDKKCSRRMVLAAGGHDLVAKSALKTDLVPAIEAAMKLDLVGTLALADV
ncbi:MAG: response regulator [Chloroflexi bacterium]|nr:response regulator [Chloroflexota bacterium]